MSRRAPPFRWPPTTAAASGIRSSSVAVRKQRELKPRNLRLRACDEGTLAIVPLPRAHEIRRHAVGTGYITGTSMRPTFVSRVEESYR